LAKELSQQADTGTPPGLHSLLLTQTGKRSPPVTKEHRDKQLCSAIKYFLLNSTKNYLTFFLKKQ